MFWIYISAWNKIIASFLCPYISIWTIVSVPQYFKTVACLCTCRQDVPVGVPLDLSTPTGMSCIGTYGENCKTDNVSKYRVLLVAFLLLWHEN